MALITDPDNLLDAENGGDSEQNIFINTANRTIKIRNNAASASAFRSRVKQRWSHTPSIVFILKRRMEERS